MESQFNLRGEHYGLYPHEFENYVMVVPNILQEKSTILKSILEFPLLSVWTITICIIFLCRTAIRKLCTSSASNDWIEIFFNTFGLSFGMSGATNVLNTAERVLILFLSIFTILSSNLCTSILFNQQFTTVAYMPSINAFCDLDKYPVLEVYMPADFHNNTRDWLSTQYETLFISK